MVQAFTCSARFKKIQLGVAPWNTGSKPPVLTRLNVGYRGSPAESFATADDRYGHEGVDDECLLCRQVALDISTSPNRSLVNGWTWPIPAAQPRTLHLTSILSLTNVGLLLPLPAEHQG